MLPEDKNGLLLSTKSDSGYKFVTIMNDGPLEGKFIAFADVVGDERQYKGSQSRNKITGLFGHKSVAGLGVFDDIRDAAYVGQAFYGEDNASRNANLDALFEGDETVIPRPPTTRWKHDPDYDSMKKAQEQAVKRVVIDIQQSLANFYKEHKAEYNATLVDAATIRATMQEYIDSIKKPTNKDMEEAARLGFEPFKK